MFILKTHLSMLTCVQVWIVTDACVVPSCIDGDTKSNECVRPWRQLKLVVGRVGVTANQKKCRPQSKRYNCYAETGLTESSMAGRC